MKIVDTDTNTDLVALNFNQESGTWMRHNQHLDMENLLMKERRLHLEEVPRLQATGVILILWRELPTKNFLML